MIKKTILMLLVLVGGVITANAVSKRIYIEVQNTYWTSPAQTELKMFFKSGDSDLNDWPGDACTRIGETNWYYIDFDNDSESALCIITTNSGNWTSNEVPINLSKKNIVYLYDDGGAKLSIQNYDKFVIANSERVQLAELSQDNYTFSGVVDFTSASGDTYFAVFPKRSEIIGDWTYCFRPNSDNDYELNSFQNYSWNFTTSNNGKTWKETQKMKYNVTFDLVAGTFTFTPYFERTIAGAQYGDYFYATFSSSNNVAIPSNIIAYYANSTQDNKVIMTAFEDGIRSTDGAFLRLPSASGSYKFSAVTTTDSPTTNYLKPSSDGSAPAGSYVFARQNGAVGFFKVSSGISTGLADKAYLELPSSNPAPSLDIEFDDGETTGIYMIEAGDFEEISGNGQMYDLQGRRVAEPSKGIYIVNGKKVIIK